MKLNMKKPLLALLFTFMGGVALAALSPDEFVALCGKESVEEVKKALLADVDVNARDKNGATSCRSRAAEIIPNLLKFPHQGGRFHVNRRSKFRYVPART